MFLSQELRNWLDDQSTSDLREALSFNIGAGLRDLITTEIDKRSTSKVVSFGRGSVVLISNA